MAKTIKDITDEINAESVSRFGFDIEATSNAGDWKLLRGLFAIIIYSVYQFFDLFKSEVSAIADAQNFGNVKWWHSKITAFQYNDVLVYKNGTLVYNTVDESKQIITRCAVKEELIDGMFRVRIKVAKTNSGATVALSGAEMIALDSYVNHDYLGIKPCGVDVDLSTGDASEVKTTETIYYDGKLLESDVRTKLIDARNTYLAGIVFDGEFNINKYRDALEAVVGAGNVDINTVGIKDPGKDIVSVSRVYTATYGHYKLMDNNETFVTLIPN